MSSPTLEDALALVLAAHRGERYRSAEPEPSVLHSLRVLARLADPIEQIVALLRDLVEHAAVSLDDLRQRGYPESVVAAVDALTHRPDESDDAYLQRLSTNPIVRRVKLADLTERVAKSARLPSTPETRARLHRDRHTQATLLAADSGPELRLETDRLVLREWTDDDLDALLAFKSDAEVLRYTHEETLDRDGARGWLDGAMVHNRVRPRRAYNMAIALRASGAVIGWLGFGVPSGPSAPDEYSFGYQLARAHWGRGYATEAVRRMLGYLFEELRAHRVYAQCDPRNAASARVLEKAGLRREAHFVRRDLKRGEWCDALQYAILAEDVAGGQ